MKKLLCTLFLLLPLTAAPAFAEDLSIHGSTVFTAALIDHHKAELEKETGLTLNVVGSSAGEGVADVAEGKAQIAMITGKLSDLVEKLNAKKPGSVDASSLKTFEMGKTRVAFAVHPSNAVETLSREQIVKILNGDITNWKDVGGNDAPVILVTGVPATGLRSAVEKDLLGGEPITDKAKTLVSSSLIGAVVEKAPNALGIVVTDMLTAKMKEVKVDGTKDIPLAMVTKGEPSAAAKKMIDATSTFAKK